MHVGALCMLGGGFQCWKEAVTLQDVVPSMKDAVDIFILHAEGVSVQGCMHV